MSFIANPNAENTNTVAGGTPLQQGSGGSMSSTTTEQPSGDANQLSSSGSAVIESSQQGQNTTNRKGPASSGMFTNIQKYVQKNQPQAKKMAGAVNKDFGKQAGEIRKAAESKKAQQDQLLDINKQKIEENRNWAKNQISKATGTTPQNQASTPISYNPSEADQTKFQNLMRGDIKDINKVQDLNLAKQQNRMAALGQLAQSADTEQGRRNLLGQTFQKQGKYTRGMSGLDQLITSGDKAAREQLIQGTQGTAKDLGSQLQGMSKEAQLAKKAQDVKLQGFGKDISGLVETEVGKFSGLGKDIEGLKATDKEIQDLTVTPEEQAQLDESTAKVNQYNKGLDAVKADYERQLQYVMRGHSPNEKLGLPEAKIELAKRKEAVNNYEKALADITAKNAALNADIQSRVNQTRALESGNFRKQIGATAEDVDRYNALQSLLGGQNKYNIQDLIDRYKRGTISKAKTGGTLKR